MTTNRLLISFATGVAFIGLAGCSALSVDSYNQVLADAKLVVGVTPTILAGIQSVAPKVIPHGGPAEAKIENALALATTGLTALQNTSSSVTSATTLAGVINDVNVALQVVGEVLPAAVAQYPALSPYVVEYDSAVALVPVIEAYLSTVVTSKTAAVALPVAPVRARVTPTDARIILTAYNKN